MAATFCMFLAAYLQLWPCFVVVGGIAYRAPQRLRWAPHNFVGAWLDLEMATGRNPSGSAVPYPHPPTLTPTL
jgi:hypothetical protein